MDRTVRNMFHTDPRAPIPTPPTNLNSKMPLIPAGYMHKTEANIAHNPNVLITLGSSKVEGLHGIGAGFLIMGNARFVMSGPVFDFMKEKFSWLRATLAVTIETATQS